MEDSCLDAALNPGNYFSPTSQAAILFAFIGGLILCLIWGSSEGRRALITRLAECPTRSEFAEAMKREAEEVQIVLWVDSTEPLGFRL
ncbi:hypothetical protein IFR04_014487, partial [Cadophora malorum]